MRQNVNKCCGRIHYGEHHHRQNEKLENFSKINNRGGGRLFGTLEYYDAHKIFLKNEIKQEKKSIPHCTAVILPAG